VPIKKKNKNLEKFKKCNVFKKTQFKKLINNPFFKQLTA